jgi:hypothetical protein
MSRWLPRTTRSPEPDRLTTIHVQGYWLVLTQIVLGILALFALLVFVVSLPVYAMQLQTVCRATSCTAGQLTLAAVQTLHGFGISVNGYVLFRLVSDPIPKGRGLCLSSTATRHTELSVPLWLRRLTHQGVLTRRPSWSSLAGSGAFAS